MLASSLALLGVMGAARPVAADATEGFAPVSGSRLFYRVEGAGEPLLLLAGFNCDHAIWDALTPMLSHRFRVIRFDNRGIGRSVGNDDAADLAGLTTRLMAEDTAALLRALDIRRAHVLGHSWGGQIAQELSLRFPYLVATLSLLSCWAKPDAKLAWLIRLFGDLATTLDDDRYPRALLPWMFTDDAFNAAPKAMEDAALQWAANPLRPSPALLFAQSRAILATDTAAQLGGIDTPTSVIVATGDALTPPAPVACLGGANQRCDLYRDRRGRPCLHSGCSALDSGSRLDFSGVASARKLATTRPPALPSLQSRSAAAWHR